VDKGVYPGSSPDFNVIEHLWAELKGSVFIEPRPTNRQELIDRVQNKLKSFTKSQLRNLVESFPNRIK
jgi:transposase